MSCKQWLTHATPDGFNLPIAMPPNARPGGWAIRLTDVEALQ